MKRILILLLGLFGVAYGQFSPTSAKSAFKWGVSIGTRDSTAYAANDSLVVVINRQGRMMYRSTDGYWKILSNAASSDYVPYTGAVDNVSLGNFRLTARSLRTDSIYANGSGGMYLLTNSGNPVAHWGAGGSVEVDFKGFAGYDANRAGSYTARSFTDKNYVDSADGLRLLKSDSAIYYDKVVRTFGNQSILGEKIFEGKIISLDTITGKDISAELTLNSQKTTSLATTETLQLLYVGDRAATGETYLSVTRPSSVSDPIEINAVKGGIGGDTLKFQTTGAAASFGGNLIANSFIKSGGVSTEFLKADGSVDANTYLTSSSLFPYKLIADTFFTTGYTTRARTKQIFDSLASANAATNAATYVPYSGATGSVNLGTNSLSAGQINWGSGSYSAGVSSLFNSATNGSTLVGKTGSTYDFQLVNGSGSGVMSNYTGTQDLLIGGDVFNGAKRGVGAFSVGRTYTSLNRHSFDDYSILNPSIGGLGFGVFDATTEMIGSLDNNHLITYQSRTVYNSTGNLTGDYGLMGLLVANAHNSSGTITNNYGISIYDPTGSGSITNNYGIKIDNITRGTNNFSIKTGLGKVSFGDTLILNSITSYTTSPTFYLSDSAGIIKKKSFYTNGASNGFKTGGLISYANGVTDRYTNIGYDITGGYGWIQPLYEGVAYTPLILNGAGGNVGIGTTTPSTSLHVIGAATISTSVSTPKIIGNSSTPSITLGSNITGSVSVTGTDMAGTVTVTVTSASGLSTLNELFTLTYNSVYSSTPNVVWSPASANAAALLQAAGGLYLKNSGTSSFQIATVNSYTTPASATYSFTYHVIQ